MGLAFLRGLFLYPIGRLTAVNQNENLARKGHRGWLQNSVPKSYATVLFL